MSTNWKRIFGVAAVAFAATAAQGFAQDDLESALMENPSAGAAALGATGAPASAPAPKFAVPRDAKAPSASSSVSAAPSKTAAPKSSVGGTLQADPLANSASLVSDDGKTIVVRDANVSIPKGEGYEATISANGQGLLVELGLCEVGADGEVVLDENGESKRVPLTRGLQLRKGDVLGKQKDADLVQQMIVAEQELLVAQKEAEKVLEVEVSEAAARVAEASYKRAEMLNRKMPGSISPEEVQEKHYDWIRAVKSVEKAKYDLEVNREKVKVAQARVDAAKVLIEDRKFFSPIDGVVDEVLQNEGEWLREGDDVLRIIRLDKVQVAGRVAADKYAPENIDGKEVAVTVVRPGMEPQELKGKIVYVRQVIESGHYYFYADVENQKNAAGYWLLNPGALVTLKIFR